MSTAKSFFWIIAAFGLGIFLISRGATEYGNAKKLADHGKAITATVVDSSERASLRRGTTYYLTIQFQPATGDSVTRKIQVSSDVYEGARSSASVNVFYLPENPEVCAAGKVVTTPYRNLGYGGFMMLLGVILTGAWYSTRKAVVNIEKSVNTLATAKFEYAPANPQDFPQLDLGFYDQSQRVLEQQGFTFLTNQENVTLSRKSGIRTLLRSLVSQDQGIIAYIYHFKQPKAPFKEAKVADMESGFTNGHYITTSNAAMAGKLDSPPAIDSLFLSARTPVETVLQTHFERVAGFLSVNPGVASVKITSVADARRFGDELQRVKSQFRQQAGISKAELERIAGRSDSQIDDIHANLAERRGQDKS
jgi:hypothetical protein